MMAAETKAPDPVVDAAMLSSLLESIANGVPHGECWIVGDFVFVVFSDEARKQGEVGRRFGFWKLVDD